MATRARGRPAAGVLNSVIHFRRFDLNKSGKTIEEIAQEEGVRPDTVRTSIEAVNLYRTRNTHENLNHVLTSVVMELGKPVKDALEGALTSEIEIIDGDKKHNEPDHSTRLKAVAEVRQIAQVVQPKAAPSTNVNVGVNQVTRVASAGYVGMEDRLTKIRQQRKDQPQIAESSVVAGVMEQPAGEFAMHSDGDEDEAEE